jgi:hypothetical protein
MGGGVAGGYHASSSYGFASSSMGGYAGGFMW